MVTSRRLESRIETLKKTSCANTVCTGWQLAFKLAVIQFFYGRYLLIGKGILKKLPASSMTY